MYTVGFIGVGVMGKPMTKNLLKAGFLVVIYARSPQKVQDVVQAGATLMKTIHDVAEPSDVIITMLPNSPQVEEVLLGPGEQNGLLAAARPGTIIIDMSTIAPAASQKFYQLCAARHVHFLDAPVSGGSQGAEKGTLTIMVGGDKATFDAALPVLQVMGTKENIFHVGPSGTGQVIKIANNMLCGVIAAGVAEALVLGVKAGADLETLHKVIGVSSGSSWQLTNQFPARVYNGSFQPGFMTDLLHKDLGLALDLAAQNGVPIKLTSVARQLYEASQAAGNGSKDYTAFIRLLEEPAGVAVRTKQA